MTEQVNVHGLMVEFETPEAILRATRAAHSAGYRALDAYTPYTVEGLATELGVHRSRIPFVVLVGGLVGAGSGFFMQYYSMAVDYPFNSGGRPLNSWPVFVPVAFEVLILVAALAAFLSVLLLTGLPHPNHPVFNVPEFVRASQDRFFLCIEGTDEQFDLDKTAKFLAGLEPCGKVIVVPIAPEAVEEPDTASGGNAPQPSTIPTDSP